MSADDKADSPEENVIHALRRIQENEQNASEDFKMIEPYVDLVPAEWFSTNLLSILATIIVSQPDSVTALHLLACFLLKCHQSMLTNVNVVAALTLVVNALLSIPETYYSNAAFMFLCAYSG